MQSQASKFRLTGMGAGISKARGNRQLTRARGDSGAAGINRGVSAWPRIRSPGAQPFHNQVLLAFRKLTNSPRKPIESAVAVPRPSPEHERCGTADVETAASAVPRTLSEAKGEQRGNISLSSPRESRPRAQSKGKKKDSRSLC